MNDNPPDFEQMLATDLRAERRLFYGEIALLAVVLVGAWLYRLLIA